VTGPHQPNARAHGHMPDPDLDLFGNPEPPPKHGGIGYLAWLAELPYPDGHRFWALAHARWPKHAPAETTEIVWLIDPDGKFRQAAINITDGSILTDRGGP
jgi:hypothetical protein